MTIAYGDKPSNPRIARTYRGRCAICGKPILPGQAYEDGVMGTNTLVSKTVHYNCYKPVGAPTWEEILALRKEGRK